MPIVLFCSVIAFLFLIVVICAINFFYNNYNNYNNYNKSKPIRIRYIVGYFLIAICTMYSLTNANLSNEVELLKSQLSIMSESMLSLKHYRMDTDTLANDVNYLRMIDAEIKWQKQSGKFFDDVYTMRLNDAGKVIFIVDSETDYDSNNKFEGDRESRTQIGEQYDKSLPDLNLAFAEKKFAYTKNFYNDKWGTWLSAFYPIYDSDNKFEALIGVDISAKKVGMNLLWYNMLLAAGFLSLYGAFLLYKKNQMSNFLLNENLKNHLFESEKNLKYQKQFLAVMSHEIRTPLNAIIGSLQLIETEKLNVDVTDNINNARESSHILADIIGDILDYSKIQAGQIQLDRSEIVLKKTFDQISNLFKAQMSAKKINLNFKIDSTIADCSYGLDEVRLRQILVNFISNAIKFTSAGSVSVFVKPIKIDQFKSILEFRIIDTGIGISAENQKKLFQAFQQADSTITRKFGGSGLGLVIAKNLIEAMGGQIYFDSILGQGTTFVFTLKVENINKNTRNPISEKNRMSFAFEKYSELKILVVDDVQINQIVLLKTLKKIGFQCDLAANGQEAILKHETEKYDVIFMDCQMPVMDGLQATKNIRQTEKNSHISKPVTIIALTANASTEDKTECLAVGMDQFISKPFTLNQIENALQNLIEQTDINSKRTA